MINTIRLMLEYNTYCVWLYDEDGFVIDNDNPPELADDEELTNAFMAVSDLYDSFFIDNDKEFRYVGCPGDETREALKSLIDRAVEILTIKNNGKYNIQNDIDLNF
ncbi:MAG: hypothetical protein IKG25_01690 [Mogibacterium sp.]|nr:hypothetical protein [Mogibacterium sp.]MBR4090603.1 hypothetical protein [Mogibacterium sp.]